MTFHHAIRILIAAAAAFLVIGAMFLVLIFGGAAIVTRLADRLSGGDGEETP